jgi:hypothetical protein
MMLPMHIIVGLIRIMLAHVAASLYGPLRLDMLGRLAIRLSCDAFLAGGGVDDAAVDVAQRMGPDGIRLLQGVRATNKQPRKLAAELILQILDLRNSRN